MHTIKTTLILIAITSISSIAFAIGQENLKPKDSIPQEAENITNQENGASSLQDKEASSKAPQEPSKLSQALANKTFIQSDLGYAILMGGDGDWTGGLNSQVAAGYQVLEFMEGLVHATFRYSPVDVVVSHNRQSYKGIIESFGFGGQWSKPTAAPINYIFGGDLAIVKKSLKSVDSYNEEQSLEAGMLNLTGFAGANFKLLEKITYGTRVRLGLGSMSLFNISGNINFIF